MTDVDSNPDYPDVDQRREPRFPTFFFANIMHENGDRITEATVRDYSNRGAQVRMKSTDEVPRRLILRFLSDNSQRRAVVKWLNGASVGLEIDPQPIGLNIDS